MTHTSITVPLPVPICYGDKIPISTVVKDFLYLGNHQNAKSRKECYENRITHIINLSKTQNYFENDVTFVYDKGRPKILKRAALENGLTVEHPPDRHFLFCFQPVYLKVPVLDSVEANLLPHFVTCFDFIENARAELGEKARILIHCQAGISRSATVVMAYLMKYQNISLDEAYIMAHTARPIICPNDSFCQQLMLFNDTLVRLRQIQGLPEHDSSKIFRLAFGHAFGGQLVRTRNQIARFRSTRSRTAMNTDREECEDSSSSSRSSSSTPATMPTTVRTRSSSRIANRNARSKK
ncbi:phosphatases II [Basidiobolus meristosporus CBS 931.73]|uniref:protein-tyrosine-phosphatase n=1 Tax=Basidiobolus meristosporus CBS 931.73 TaxID=1314790 RepID=A0A1Y1Y419_9FUNG|nr:phosphatases II [Basidiobolus meristosporus CBS 931.73]|eukprot:ORX92635.1 phosphatases II [Basidiobolus meristosporus CBS 931.73]